MESPPPESVDPTLLSESLARRVHGRSAATGKLVIPAIPGMIDEYVTMCANVFAGVGRLFTVEQRGQFKTKLQGKLAEAYSASPRSNIIISFETSIGTVLHYGIEAESWTIERCYESWIDTREPPLFGTEPDARVWALASEAPDPKAHPVLDIGAGTGRNALSLARRGHPVDAVELSSKFADMMRTEAARESLNVRVIQGDIFSTKTDLRRDYQLIALSEVVPVFRTTQQLRGMFELAADCLAPGGRLVFNAFLTRYGYAPDNAALELGEHCGSSIFTQHQMSTAAATLPLELLSDESVYEFEKAHLPAGAWPPTGWYADWVSGLEVFDVEREKCPIELRWLVYQKTP